MIKYLVMDVDGTLTDGRIYMSQNEELCKAFHVKDGYGIAHLAVPAGITPVIITGRTSEIVERRGREMGVTKIYQGETNKILKLREVTDNLSEVAYIGDDCNDLSCILPVKAAGGLIGCPKDAVKQVISIADYVAEHNGGEGAVRDFIEWLLERRSVEDHPD